MSQATDKITELAKTAAFEVENFERKGSNAAATRARKALQEIKHVATVERKRIQDVKHGAKKEQAA